MSPPAWGRGLKLITFAGVNSGSRSPPAWGRGLKPYSTAPYLLTYSSPPAWGRGLKHMNAINASATHKSPPAWGRGLKLLSWPLRPCYRVAPRVGAWIETNGKNNNNRTSIVAPRVGAWIETAYSQVKFKRLDVSPPAWGRGLKLEFSIRSTADRSRPPRGGVD